MSTKADRYLRAHEAIRAREEAKRPKTIKRKEAADGRQAVARDTEGQAAGGEPTPEAEAAAEAVAEPIVETETATEA
jgi:hypothetical protein